MTDKELGSTRVELRARHSSESLSERSIGGGRVGMSGSAGVVEGREDTRRALLLDEVADDLIVEVVDGSPLSSAKVISKEEAREGGTGGRTLICSRTYSSCSVLSVS
jgi:hypothetical protein